MPRRRRSIVWIDWFRYLAVAVVVVAVAWSCVSASNVDDSRAVNAMTASGFTNVRVVERHRIAAWHGCGEDDVVAFKVKGTNVNGQVVDATVCVGWMKDATVRF